MTDFTPQINNFEKYGTFNYKFDEAGNIILNPSSSIYQQFYIAIPLSNVNYDENKIISFCDIEFKEFINPNLINPTSSIPVDIVDKLNFAISQNKELQDRLNLLIAQNELNNSSANIQLVRDIIMGLRMQLGEGVSTSDFQDVFPYLPISLEELQNPPTTEEQSQIPPSA